MLRKKNAEIEAKRIADEEEAAKDKEEEETEGPAMTSNWAVCCTLNPHVLPPIPPEGVKVPGGTRTRDLP
ncbi:hypothetical protein Tco_1455178 [Tanacetum coccineum]